MTTPLRFNLAMTGMIFFAAAAVTVAEDGNTAAKQRSGTAVQIVKSWPERPRLGALQMIEEYGEPQEATPEQLMWHDKGGYKRIQVTKQEDKHDFPKPHTDFMQHTVAYKVPIEKAIELTKFDGSLTFDRTRGEMSARCDLEGHNLLTLNLANDIVQGKLNAMQARQKFGDIVVEDVLGKGPAYVTRLQFRPAGDEAKFVDVPTLAGAPKRAETVGDVRSRADGEVLGMLVALNENEIVAAMEADKHDADGRVGEYARMLHTEHGKNIDQTLKLGQKINVTPLETASTDKLRRQGAAELARLVPLEDEQFAPAYIAAMVKGHREALNLIDNQLLPKAQNEATKQHLKETRTHVAAHLKAAQEIQSNQAKRTAER